MIQRIFSYIDAVSIYIENKYNQEFTVLYIKCFKKMLIIFSWSLNVDSIIIVTSKQLRKFILLLQFTKININKQV